MVRAASGRTGRGVLALAMLITLVVPMVGDLTTQPLAARAAAQPAETDAVPSGDVIVLLKPGAPAAEVVAAEVSEDVLGEIEPDVVFTHVIDGFAADVTPEQAEQLASDARVAGVFPNNPVYQASQEIPTGVKRVGADANGVAAIDGVDTRIDADVAVLDSGIDGGTGDLNVVGGVDCSGSGGYGDGSGHGTHVAGIIGALDNGSGVVGVAPGARLWSVRVLQGMTGSDANVICGLDWVFANRATIDVVNMSLVGTGANDPCTRNPATTHSPLREAVCRVTDAGIPIVAAAGNEGRDVALDRKEDPLVRPVTPAVYDEVIAVSAFADYDGQPGGLGSQPGECGSSAQDDRFWPQSNHGAAVDIMAPGVCIRSLVPGGGTVYRTGTSMAAPHVTGAIALYKSQNPGASIVAVRSWLASKAIPQGHPAGILGGDPDGIAEPLVWVGPDSGPVPSPTPTVTPPASAYRLISSGRSVNSAASRHVRDNNLSTVWSTRAAEHPPATAFVWVEMASVAPVGSIRWVFGETGIADRYWIETSTDLVTWTRIARRTNRPVGVWQEVPVNNVNAKYVRFRFENPNRDPRLGGIAEIQVWAPGVLALNATPSPTPTPIPVKYVIGSGGRTLNSIGHTYTWDGNPGTFWRTTSTSVPAVASFFVNLGTQRFIGVVRWMFATEGNADVMAIEVSSDCRNWTTVATRTNAPRHQWQEQAINRDGRCVRWMFQNPNGDPVLGGIGEVEVWSRAGGPLTSFPGVTGAVSASPTPAQPVTGPPDATPEPATTPTETPAPTIEPTATPEPTATAEPTATPEQPPATPEPAREPEPAAALVEEVVAPAAEPAAPSPYEPRRVRTSGNGADGRLAVDGSLETVWTTDSTAVPDDAYVLVDLGRARPVSVVRWLFGAPELADEYVVEVSADRRTWTEVARGGYPAAGVWAEARVWSEVRFVRFTFANPNGDPVIGGLAEVELWP